MHSGGALNESVVTKGLSALKTNWWRCTDGVNSVTFDIFCLPPSRTTIARVSSYILWVTIPSLSISFLFLISHVI